MYQRTRRRLLKLRSNFVLLLVVCAALLATPAIVMALMTGLDGNTSPTIQGEGADIADPSANPHGNTSPAPAIQGEGADIADPNANTLPAQTIQSEEAVYARGNLRGNRNGRPVRRGDDVLHRRQRVVPQYIPRSCELDRKLYDAWG
jgi:hypothetical protein